MLMKVYAPHVLSRISMHGQRDQKMAFMGSEVSKILIQVAKKTSPATERVTKANIEECVASILKGAPLRKAAKPSSN